MLKIILFLYWDVGKSLTIFNFTLPLLTKHSRTGLTLTITAAGWWLVRSLKDATNWFPSLAHWLNCMHRNLTVLIMYLFYFSVLLFMASSLASLNVLNCAFQLCRWSYKICNSLIKSWRNVDFSCIFFFLLTWLPFFIFLLLSFSVIMYSKSTSCHLTELMLLFVS